MKRRIDWSSVFEQALGGIFTTAFVYLVGIMYQALTKNKINSWIWIGIGFFLVLMLAALAWKYLRILLAKVGNYIIKNWLYFSLIALSCISGWISYAINYSRLIILVPPISVLITFILTRVFFLPKKQLHSIASNTNQAPVTKQQMYSQQLDNILKPRRNLFSGISLRFLEKLKQSPPFLDIQLRNPIIPEDIESALTEHFRAKAFIDSRNDLIRGASSYTIKTGDTWESISKEIYGDSKFSKKLQDFIGMFKLPAGAIIKPPIIDIAYPDASNEYLENQLDKASGTEDYKKSILAIRSVFHIPEDEIIHLLQIAYDAAQFTMGEYNKSDD